MKDLQFPLTTTSILLLNWQARLCLCVADSLNGPWTEEKSQNWFQGGGGVQYVGQSGDLLKEGHYEQHLPVVGEHIDYNQYQPPWQKQFKKKYKPTFELRNITIRLDILHRWNIFGLNLKFYCLIEKSYSQKQSNRNVAYPEILLPTHQSLASFKSPQNTSKNDDDGLAPRQRHKNSWESRSRFQNEEAGKLLVLRVAINVSFLLLLVFQDTLIYSLVRTTGTQVLEVGRHTL